MDQTKYDKQKLNSYIFGELPETETEFFDELSFTDDNFAAELKSAENDLIDSYVQGELSGETLKKFETVYLATAHRREKIEFARALQNVAAREISIQNETGFFASWKFLQNREFQIGFASAAVLLLVFGIFWFVNLKRGDSEAEIAKQSPTPENAVNSLIKNENTESVSSAVDENSGNKNSPNVNLPNTNQTKNDNKNQTNQTQKTPEPERIPIKETPIPPKTIVATFFLAPPVRGVGKIPVFEIAPNVKTISVNLELEANDYKTFHVTLTNETGDINLWRGNSLKARNNKLNVNFPAKLIEKGFYSLTVSGINQNGEAEIIANYPFRVEIKKK